MVVEHPPPCANVVPLAIFRLSLYTNDLFINPSSWFPFATTWPINVLWQLQILINPNAQVFFSATFFNTDLFLSDSILYLVPLNWWPTCMVLHFVVLNFICHVLHHSYSCLCLFAVLGRRSPLHSLYTVILLCRQRTCRHPMWGFLACHLWMKHTYSIGLNTDPWGIPL